VSVVTVKGLAKEYGNLRAVDGIDLAIEEGEVFALLGPNGAGKTTTVEILEGHRDRTRGEVSVLGYDPETAGRDFRERIGIVLQTTSLERELTVREAVDTYAAFYPRRRDAGEVIEIVGLVAKADARIKTLSGGQKRRLELALGIIGDPDLIFLDEPTTGFDPSARRQAWELIDNLRSLGKTILLTTHYMDEAQNLSDRVAVIAAGRIVATGTPDSIGGRDNARSQVSFTLPEGVADTDLPSLGLDVAGTTVTATPDALTPFLAELTAWAVGRGVDLEDLSVERPSLEDVYLKLTDEG